MRAQSPPAYDTTVVGLITDNEIAYREEVRDLAVWCQDNNLSLNVNLDKGNYCGLQEKDDRGHPHSHRRGCSLAG